MSVKCSACNSYTVFTIVKDQKRNDFIHYVLFHYLADWSFFRILAKYWNSPKKSPILFLVSFHRTIIWSLFLNFIYVKWVPDNLSKKNKKRSATAADALSTIYWKKHLNSEQMRSLPKSIHGEEADTEHQADKFMSWSSKEDEQAMSLMPRPIEAHIQHYRSSSCGSVCRKVQYTL